MSSMTRLIQLIRANERRVGLVDEPHLRLLNGCSSIYELANTAISNGVRLSDLARQRATGDGWSMSLFTADNPNGAFCPRLTIRKSPRAA